MDFIVGLIGFGILGTVIGYVIYGVGPAMAVVALIIAVIGAKEYEKRAKNRRSGEFELEFCDYLDSISASLSCGRNTYDSFILADMDMQDLYRKDSLICKESSLMAGGLKNGRPINDLLSEMAKRSKSENVKTFSDVYSICLSTGGNLKIIVNNTKNIIQDKITTEREIKTIIAGAENELNIMTCMPIVVTCALRMFGNGITQANSFGANTVAMILFLAAYFIGRQIVHIEV